MSTFDKQAVEAYYRDATFDSARMLLEMGWSCRSLEPRGWAVYWTNGGELTVYPGGEGPQEASSIDEALAWIGGDQPCRLTVFSVKRAVDLLTSGTSYLQLGTSEEV